MYFIFKLTVVILILYLKLIALNATPLIDRNKSVATINDDSNTLPTTSNEENQNGAEKDPGSTERNGSSSAITYDKTNRTTIYNTNNNKYNNNSSSSTSSGDNKQYKLSSSTTTTTSSYMSTKRAYKSDTSISSVSTNLTPIEITNKHTKPIANTTNDYYYYHGMQRIGEESGNENTEIAIELMNDKIDLNNPTDTTENESFTANPTNYNIFTTYPTNSEETSSTTVETKRGFKIRRPGSTLPTITMPPVFNTVNPLYPNKPVADDDNTEAEVDLTLGDHLLHQQKLNDSDVDRFLLKYDSDDGNTCLLDDVKDYLMWWSYTNGSLRQSNFNFTTKISYLDLSFHNIAQDDSLYRKSRALTYVSGRHIIAFSAAHNNLTTAPYRTLSMMNSTLRFLSLKGNQFNALSTEEAFNRIMNDTNNWYPDMNNQVQEENRNSTQNTNLTTTHDEHNSNSNSTTHEPLSAGCKLHSKLKRAKKKEGDIAWATFPPLPALIELDISNCHIEYVKKEAFQNLTNLRRLFMAHNKMLTIPFDTFQHVPALQYLDLSFTNVLDFDYQIPLPTLEAIINLVYGVKIQQNTFKYLPDLEYLDLSHTKLTRNSAVAFTHLGEKLRFLSLCYTAFPMVGNALFKNTALVALDLSGNPYAAYNVIDDAFEGVADTLQYLYFERSNIKDIDWANYLPELRVLGLAGNNINAVSLETFRPLRNLQILDLSTNHIGNWYTRAFTHNEHLRVLNLRDNNINIITSEMLKDFQLLDYLSIGDNNFVCDCLLRDLVDVAAANNKEAECSANSVIQDNLAWVVDYMTENASKVAEAASDALQFRKKLNISAIGQRSSRPLTDAIASKLLLRHFVPNLKRSYMNMRRYNKLQRRYKLRFVTHLRRVFKLDSSGNAANCQDAEPSIIYDKLNSSALKFQLLDYDDDHYWCFNETERLHFVQLNCVSRSFVDDITEKLHTLTNYVVGSVVGVLALTIIGFCIYLKRWHIHYYYSSLKSAALVSVASKENCSDVDKSSTNDAEDAQNPGLMYDIFISYCQNDRQWVFEELLPNVEETGDISICMHERDFQIGVTILDNIMSCMDRSRALMLIISSNFLLSHWCQFEMHLAQHRIFEVSKEHLILVFLEDIPRSKRPKSLQYLMEVKTYIKWPSSKRNKPVRPEERKLFWRRLRRSLENIGLHYGSESRA